MTALKALVGASQIVFGSDFPFATPLESIQGLQSSGMSAEELRAVLGDNALRIFPRWKKV
jgi:aminocarboxymuconate-semialdehyde decarboxylase